MVLRYAVRIWSFVQTCSSCHASAASFSLRVIVGSLPVSEFFTNCCVIVEPPWTAPWWRMSAQSARPMPRMSMPRCSQKRLSSVATIACLIHGEMAALFTSTRLCEPRRTARIV